MSLGVFVDRLDGWVGRFNRWFGVPLWLPRYFVLLTPFLAVLLAAGVARLRPRTPRLAWGVLLVLVEGWALARYARDASKEPWRQVTAAIASRSPAGHTAVLVPFFAFTLGTTINAASVWHAGLMGFGLGLFVVVTQPGLQSSLVGVASAIAL